MIVRRIEPYLWLFDQRDHSALCGRMAEQWGAPPFRAVPPSVQLAAAVHDSGWPEWDERPRLDRETERPHPYSRMPEADYHAIWVRGLQRGWACGDEAGLLISLHGMRFFAGRDGPRDRALYRAQREHQAGALRRLNAASDDVGSLPEPFATWHAWMFFWDGLSLFLCEGWESPWVSRLPLGDGGEVEVRVTRTEAHAPGGTVEIRPYPFRVPLELTAPARLIPDRSYTSQQELDAVVAAADRRAVRWLAIDAA